MIIPSIRWAFKRPGLIPVFFLSLFTNGLGQQWIHTAPGLARGEIGVVNSPFHTLVENPASQGDTKKTNIAVGHNRPFIIQNPGISHISLTFPAYPGTLRFRSQNYGVTGCQYFIHKLSYGMQLSEKLNAGIGFTYYHTMAYGRWNYLWETGITAGIIFKPSRRLVLGILVKNPVTIGNYPEYGKIFPAYVSLGLRYQFYEKSVLTIYTTYGTNHGFKIGGSMEYGLASGISLAAGYHSWPSTYSFGPSLKLQHLKIDLAAAWTKLTGIHPAIMISWIK